MKPGSYDLYKFWPNSVATSAYWKAMYTYPKEYDADVYFSELCREYRNSEVARRSEIRSLLETKPDCWMYAARMANLTLRTCDVTHLLNGVTALVIENCKYDPRDTTVMLVMLRFASDHCKMDFQSVCESIPLDAKEDDDIVVITRRFFPVNCPKLRLGEFAVSARQINGFTQVTVGLT